MIITPLSQVRLRVYTYTICVRISRVWEFHGKNDDDTIKHLDLVVIDQKGTTMYAEVPPEAMSALRPQLQENKILIMRKNYIDNAKQSYKPVRAMYMIRLHPKTMLQELPQLEGNNEYFIDVITALSDPTMFSTNSGAIRMKRLIHLMDLRRNKIEVSLWGPRAEEFLGEQIFRASEKNHVIAIFVGTSVKYYGGSTPFLSGTAVCCWYKISLYGTDGTCELEFMLFDERGTSLIGKTADKLIRQNNRSELPPEISAIVGEKLTVVVKVFPAKSIHKRGPNKDNKDPTFDILSIKKRHGKDLLLSMFKNEEVTSLLGTSSSQNPKLPPLEPIEQRREEIKVQLSSQISLL
ncbi:hypothetical protein BS78_05G254100 [Paspalum vaginatum]|nr:hypothetical protein BS78_05G254100 [Paspalum vaginatum]